MRHQMTQMNSGQHRDDADMQFQGKSKCSLLIFGEIQVSCSIKQLKHKPVYRVTNKQIEQHSVKMIG